MVKVTGEPAQTMLLEVVKDPAGLVAVKFKVAVSEQPNEFVAISVGT